VLFFRFDRKSGDIEILTKKRRPRTPALSKGQLVKQIAAKLDLPQADVDADIRDMLTNMISCLKSGQPIVLSGFGRFRLRKSRSGKSRNPKTGKLVAPTGRFSVTFRPSSCLRRALA
jgi:nucleoid DNA-binding protein